MVKMSKYEKLVGQMVDDVLVSDFKKTQKTSLKTGRTYTKYEVELDNIVWVSTTAFNRGTYHRKLNEARGLSYKESKRETRQETRQSKTGEKVYTFTESELKELIDKVRQETIKEVELKENAEIAAKGAWSAKEILETTTKELILFVTDDENFFNCEVDDYGKVISTKKKFKDADDFFKNFVEDLVLEGRCNGKYEHPEDEYFDITFLEEWRTEYRDRYYKMVQEEWKKVEERYNKKVYGANINEFDLQFKDLNDIKEIKSLYRKLSKQHHPDMPTGDRKQFIKLKEAYDKAVERVA